MKMDAKKKAKWIDLLLLAMIVLPFVGCMALRVFTRPLTEGIAISGAQIYLQLPMPILGDLVISEAQVVSAAVMIALMGLCLFLTRRLAIKPQSKRQIVAEWIVEKVNGLVLDNMGERFRGYAPFVAAIMGLSAFSSLSSLLGLYPPTSDVNILVGWALLVFGLITYYKLKGGLWNYVKGYFEPIPLFAPMNVIGEIATPVSMSFRHFGNVLSGVVISTLIASALAGLSNTLLGWLPGFLGEIPFLRVGLPAILSMYFDVFSGCLQAFIFAMLTMLNISLGFPEEAYERRKAKREKKALHLT